MIWIGLGWAGYLAGTEDQVLRSSDLLAADLQGGDVSGGFDVDGDGLDDIAVGARLDDSSKGTVYLWYGDEEVSTYSQVVAPTRIAGVEFGASVDLVGDLDGDGYAELVVGAPYESVNATEDGAVYLFNGGPSGPVYEDRLSLPQASQAWLGYRVSDLGDVNGDGYEDFGATALRAFGGLGAVHVYLGGSTLSSVEVMTTDATSQYFGQALAGAGDLDDDGFDDIVVGASTTSSGSAGWVVFGGSAELDSPVKLGTSTDYGLGSFLAGGGDIDGDGFDDVVIGSPFEDLSQGAVYVVYGAAGGWRSSWDEFGPALGADALTGHGVAVVGDIDLDGQADIAVGSWGKGDGRVDVVHGASDGLGDSHVLKPSSSTGVTTAGYSVSTGGDINGDGHADLIAGSNAEGALIFFGCVDGDSDGVCLALDCNDQDSTVGSSEVQIYRDEDGDGFGGTETDLGCGQVPDGWSDVGGDCDDGDQAVYPAAPEEIGDGVDQDCDGKDACWVDADGDGFHAGELFLQVACPGDPAPGDCDDSDGGVSPAAEEVCGDGVDQDCDDVDPACDSQEETGLLDTDEPGPPFELRGASGGCGHTGAAGAWVLGMLLLRRRR